MNREQDCAVVEFDPLPWRAVCLAALAAVEKNEK